MKKKLKKLIQIKYIMEIILYGFFMNIIIDIEILMNIINV